MIAKHEKEKGNKNNIPAVEEAYKTLRTNIRFCGVVNKLKTICVTSCTPDEGKTTTVVNLAISMADSGIKTLIVDADLRKPTVEKMLGINAKIGLTSYMMGEAEIEDIIYKTETENLYATPCGIIPPNPAELLSSNAFSEFVKKVKTQYFKKINGEFDIVIFDTPPLGSVIDAAIVAAQTDGTLLVIKSKFVSYKFACQIKSQLEKANANILGVVINGVDKNDLKYGYKNYYNYYYKENKEKEKEEKNYFKKIIKNVKESF